MEAVGQKRRPNEAKLGQNEAKMEPWRTKNDPKVDKSGAKDEVWDHM